MEKKIAYYELVPRYEPDAGQIATAAVVTCCLTGKPLSGMGGPKLAIDPELLNLKWEWKAVYDFIVDGRVQVPWEEGWELVGGALRRRIQPKSVVDYVNVAMDAIEAMNDMMDYDESLDAAEEAPDGDSYNEVMRHVHHFFMSHKGARKKPG